MAHYKGSIRRVNNPSINDTLMMEEIDNQQPQWSLFGKHIPKHELVFFAQVILIYIVIISCIINLSMKNGDSNLWTALLGSCLGYILPSPSLKLKKSLHVAVSRSNSTGGL